MSEQQNVVLPNWIKALFGLLIIAVAIQGYWIYHLAADQDNPESAPTEQSVAENSPAQPPSTVTDPSLLAPDLFDPQAWDPFTEMQRMHQQMNEMFNDAFGRFGQSDRFSDLLDSEISPIPKIDVSESDAAYDISVDIPGAEESEIETTIKGQTLTIAGKTDESVEQQDDQADSRIIRKERMVGKFNRSIYLPEPVDPSQMETRYEDGVLSIHIPKLDHGDGTHS